MSLRSRVDSQKKKEQGSKVEWDQTTTASQRAKKSVEEKMASQIAMEVLRDNQKLRGIHSNVSIKKIIENEAKRQLLS